jgi:hypothetical protein
MQDAVLFPVNDDQSLISIIQRSVSHILQPLGFPHDSALDRLQIEDLAGESGETGLESIVKLDHRITVPKHPVIGGEMLETFNTRAKVAEEVDDISGMAKVTGGDEELFLTVHPAEELFDFPAQMKGRLLSLEDNVHAPPAAEQDNQQRQQDDNESGAEF